MYRFHGNHRFLNAKSLSFFSSLIDQCILLRSSSTSSKSIHAQLIKLGFNSNTFLGNRCIDLYLHSRSAKDALKAFDEIRWKNVVSWNLYLKVIVRFHDMAAASNVFDEMPERDVVSWNTMISGYISCGFDGNAWEMFLDMRNNGVRPSEFTFSILMSCLDRVDYIKEIHGSMIRNGVDCSALVLANCLVNVYGKRGLVDYAVAVFCTMGIVDVISWNSLISACYRSGHYEFALQQFCSMRGCGYRPDEYTFSSVLTVCSNLRNLEKGMQMFCLSVKMGFLWSTIVSSAAIDLFSKCNRVEDASSVFHDSVVFDSALSNAIIACYASHDMEEYALKVFVLALREDVRPTEFTFSSVLGSAAVFLSVELGAQLHCLCVKWGFESDSVVSSSLVDMYNKYGLIDYAMKVFANVVIRDLISWNAMMLGLAHNGKAVESLCLFEELLDNGMHPDHITFAGVLLACNYGGLYEAGLAIFSSMQNVFKVSPRREHYTCAVDIMSRAGNIEEALILLETMPEEPDACMWESVLHACKDHENMKLIEAVAYKMIELEPQSSLPYLVLAHAYERRGKWESLVRVRKEVERMTATKVLGCSWISIKDGVFIFQGNQMIHSGGNDVYSILRLLTQEIQEEVEVCLQTMDGV